MADPPRDRQAAKRRASFARAERLRREAGQDRPKKKDPARQAHSSASLKKTLRAKRDHLLQTVARTPRQRERIKAMFDGYEQFIDRTDAVKARLKAHQRQTASGRESEQKRVEQKRQQDKAKDTRQRSEARQAQAKRAEDRRRAQDGKDRADKVERRRDQQRRGEIGRRQQLMRAAAQKAALDMEREQKRQRDERQAGDRRQTDVMRSRHRMERKSFQSNELAMLERHHGAIKRLEAAEQRELGELVGRQRGLVGRLAALKPGGAKKQEQERQAVRDRHHAERMTRHRDLEAFKERQFAAQQATRLAHARERLELMRDHRDGRLQLERQQDAQRPMLVAGRRDAIVAVQAREQAREQPAKERPPVRDISTAFERAR